MDMQELKQEAQREARREYAREWRKRNPEKVQAAQERYWAKKAAEIAAKREKALAALLLCPTARTATKSAGLTESTFCRYQKDL